MKNNKGITLIALIITIIIMLILVAVTVSILINSGIIGKAKKAKDDTQTAFTAEQRAGDVLNINGREYSFDDYIDKLTKDPNAPLTPPSTYVYSFNTGWNGTNITDDIVAYVTVNNAETTSRNDGNTYYDVTYIGTGEMGDPNWVYDGSECLIGTRQWMCGPGWQIRIVNAYISYGITSIVGYNFYSSNYQTLKSVEIPNSITKIGEEAFCNCSSLTSVFIPESVIIVEGSSSYGLFNGCSSSLKIYCEAASQPSGWDTHWNRYNYNTALTSITWGCTRDQYEAAN